MRLAILGAFFGVFSVPLSAETINIDFGGDPNEAIVYLTDNGPGAASLGFFEGFTIGVEVRGVNPDPKNGVTSGIAISGDRVINLTPLGVDQTLGGAVASDLLSDLDDARGDWAVTLRNGPDELSFSLAGVGDVVLPQDISDARIIGGFDTLTPTLGFSLPTSAPSFVSVYDLLDRNEITNFATSSDIFFLPQGTDTFDVPAGLIEENGLYAFSFSTTVRREAGTFNPTGSSQEGALLAQNVSYVFYTPLDDAPNGIEELYLPTVSVDTDGLPTYVFNNPVFAGQVAYYDPLLAVGYDYSIGNGNPLFKSVILPEVGDGFFEILLKGTGDEFVFLDKVAAGEEYVFADGGVDFFRILGIETSASLDPFDTTAFVTGLSFVEDGVFTGSMKPITQEVAAIPLPASAWFLIISLGLLGCLRRQTTT